MATKKLPGPLVLTPDEKSGVDDALHYLHAAGLLVSMAHRSLNARGFSSERAQVDETYEAVRKATHAVGNRLALIVISSSTGMGKRCSGGGTAEGTASRKPA